MMDHVYTVQGADQGLRVSEPVERVKTFSTEGADCISFKQLPAYRR